MFHKSSVHRVQYRNEPTYMYAKNFSEYISRDYISLYRVQRIGI